MESSGRNKKILIIAISVFFAVVAGAIIEQNVLRPSTEKQLEKAAALLNKKCPMLVDEETRLDNTLALPGKVFQYNFTLVNMVIDSINIPAFEENMKPLIISGIKTNPQLKAYRNKQVTLTYCYSDKNGKLIYNISVTPEMYKEK
jgi:hypothetical protein